MGKRLITTLGPIFSLFLIQAGFPAQLGAAEKFKVATIKSLLFYLPVLAAEEKELWKKEGLDAELVLFRSTRELDTGVLAGRVQAVSTQASGAISSRSVGVPVTMVAELEGFFPWYLWVRADSPFKGPEDLKGAKITIGVLRLGGVGYIYPQITAKGLGIEKNVRYVATGGLVEAMAALKAGAVTALVLGPYTVARMEYEGVARRLMSLDDFVPRDLDPVVFQAADSAISRDPASVAKAVRGLIKAANFIMENPSWAIPKISAELNVPGPVAEKFYQTIKYSRDGRINTDRLQRTLDFLLKYDLISKEKAPALKELYADRFAPGH